MNTITVECYAGYRSEQTPRRFRLGERQLEVVDVKDQWLAPDHRYFKVIADDGGQYILRHDCGSERWELVGFEAKQNTV